MSAIGFLVLLVIAIVVLMLLMTKVKLNPVMSLFVVALAFGVVLGVFGTEGYTFMGTLNMITTGFGSTLGSLGMPIILGAVLAMGVQDTGAAKSIANFFIRLFKGKNLELAPSLTAYVVSIPVFGDITTILCSNIANVLGKRKHISMSTMASFTQTGLNLTHAMVPPTPGILAKAGCRVSIITDAPVIPLHYLPLCASFAHKAGMSKEDTLLAITLNPARHLGIEDRVGSIEPGKDADLVLMDGSFLQVESRVKAVYLDGCDLMEN